jgi:hypothetical protein
MKQIRTIVLALMLILSPTLFGEGKDLIILLDTSESLFDSYQDLKTVFFEEAITNHLQYGDSFYFVSFQESPSPEISKKINSNADVQAISRRFNQLPPLGDYTDIVSALDFIEIYANDLSPNVPKTIIIITDGRHQPPATSPHQLTGQDLEVRIGDKLDDLTDRGYEVRVLLINPPLAENGDDTSTAAFTENNASDIVTSITSTDLENLNSENNTENWTNEVLGDPVVTWPKERLELHLRDQFPLKVKNLASESVNFKIISMTWNGQEILEEEIKVSVRGQDSRSFNLQIQFPQDTALGENTGRFRFQVEGNVRPSPLSAQVDILLKDGTSLWVSDFSIILFILAIAVIILLIIFISRWFSQMSGKHNVQTTGSMASTVSLSQQELDKTLSLSQGRRPEDVLSGPLTKTSKHADDLPVSKREQKVFEKSKKKKPGVKPNAKIITGDISKIANPRIYMEVYDENGLFQNNPYKRNHVELREGQKGRIGPPPADLVVTLYRFSRVVADVEFIDGKIYFTPRDYDLFPGLDGPLKDALGKEIVLQHPAIKLTLVLGYYKSPLEEINELLAKGRPQMQTK